MKLDLDQWKQLCTVLKNKIQQNIVLERIQDQELLKADEISEIAYKTRKAVFGVGKEESSEDEEDYEAKIVRKKEQKAGISRPVEPEFEDCCNTGCEMDCVMNMYYARLDEYEEILMCTSTPSSSELDPEDED